MGRDYVLSGLASRTTTDCKRCTETQDEGDRLQESGRHAIWRLSCRYAYSDDGNDNGHYANGEWDQERRGFPWCVFRHADRIQKAASARRAAEYRRTVESD